ncbi:hypothetical protein BGZ58_007414 [Dissophora ornata]|nr:hypothetical protein BGZ58_007414 [Dissophora ornata]
MDIKFDPPLLREFLVPDYGCTLITKLRVSNASEPDNILAVLDRTTLSLRSFAYGSCYRITKDGLRVDPSALSQKLWPSLLSCTSMTHIRLYSVGIADENLDAFFEKMTLLQNDFSLAMQATLIRQASQSLAELTWNSSKEQGLATCVAKYASQITKLDISLYKDTDEEIAQMLKCLPQLTSFDAESTNFGHQSAQYLLEYRAPHLRELNIKNTQFLDVGPISQRLFWSCPNLVRFLAGCVSVNLIIPGLPATSYSKGWACHGLKELEMELIGLVDQAEPMATMELLLSQLAVLTKLEVLVLVLENSRDEFILDLGPSGQFSQRLSGLKLLRDLIVPGVQRQMTTETLDFLVRQWPKLEKLGFHLDSGDKEADDEVCLSLDSYIKCKYPHLTRHGIYRRRRTCLFT